MKYTLLHTIRGCHQDSINCVAFSPNGRFLASGADDCMLFLYNCLSGQDLVKISSSSNVTSLLWHPSSTEIWVGHANGDLQMIDPVCIFFLRSLTSFVRNSYTSSAQYDGEQLPSWITELYRLHGVSFK